LPARGGFARRQTEAPWADQRALLARAVERARHLGRPRQVIDQRRMADRLLADVERRLAKRRGVERPPARVRAVGDQAVARADRPPVCFLDPEDTPLRHPYGPRRPGLLLLVVRLEPDDRGGLAEDVVDRDVHEAVRA